HYVIGRIHGAILVEVPWSLDNVCDSQRVMIEINVFADVEIGHKIIGIADEYDRAAIGADRWREGAPVSLSGWTDADSLGNAGLQVAQEYVACAVRIPDREIGCIAIESHISAAGT